MDYILAAIVIAVIAAVIWHESKKEPGPRPPAPPKPPEAPTQEK